MGSFVLGVLCLVLFAVVVASLIPYTRQHVQSARKTLISGNDAGVLKTIENRALNTVTSLDVLPPVPFAYETPDVPCPKPSRSKCTYTNYIVDARTSNTMYIKILWSGWMYHTQWVACSIATSLSAGQDNAYALEQTNYPAHFVQKYGTWDDQLIEMKKEYMELTGKPDVSAGVVQELENIRKKVWDTISLVWAQDDRFEHVIIVLPPRKYINIKATLMTIEIPNLNSNANICIFVYDCFAPSFYCINTNKYFPVNFVDNEKKMVNIDSVVITPNMFVPLEEGKRMLDEKYVNV